MAWGPARHVVVVAPHPDDEGLAAGGAMRLLAHAGAAITIVAVSDGEASTPRDATGGIADVHGRGHSLGRRALARVVEAARAAGARAIVLETAAVLREANRLYTRSGFVPVRGADAGSFATLTEQCDLAYRLALAPDH